MNDWRLMPCGLLRRDHEAAVSVWCPLNCGCPLSKPVSVRHAICHWRHIAVARCMTLSVRKSSMLFWCERLSVDCLGRNWAGLVAVSGYYSLVKCWLGWIDFTFRVFIYLYRYIYQPLSLAYDPWVPTSKFGVNGKVGISNAE